MLQEIRDKAQGWITWLILGVIIVVFALFGISYYLSSSGGDEKTLATVNGDSISQSDFNYVYQSVSRQQADANVDTAVLQQQVLHMLINRQLLLQSAQNLGFQVSMQQLDQIIYSMPAFQVNGHFSMPRYQSILQNAGITTDQLRLELATDITVNQVQQGIALSQFILPYENTQLNTALGQKRDISYITLPSSKFASSASITQDQIQAYYEANQSNFYTQEQVQLQYILLDANHLPKGQSYGDIGNQLANLTFENPSSLDSTAKQLGLSVGTTGLITQKTVSKGWLGDPQIMQSAFSDSVLKQGNNSSVINLSSTQCVVIRVIKDIPATLKPLSMVQSQIISILQAQAGQQIAQQVANTLNSNLEQGNSIAALMQQYGLKWQQARGLTRTSQNLDSAIVSAAFSLPQPSPNKPLPALVSDSSGYAVVLVNKAYQGVSSNNSADAIALQHAWAAMDYDQYVNALKANADIKVSS